MARVEQGAERADLVAEGEDLVRDALRGSRDHETLVSQEVTRLDPFQRGSAH
jgi:hypothetical protein